MNIQYNSKEPITEMESDQASPNEKLSHKKVPLYKLNGESVSENCVRKVCQ